MPYIRDLLQQQLRIKETESDDVMNKKISLGLAISLIAIAMAVTFILTSFFSLQSFNRKVMDVNEKSKKYGALELLDSYVRENYSGKINETELSGGILKGYVSGLGDKYSRYLTADEYITEKNNSSGEVVGLGFTMTEDESGYIRISDILPDSPATESGIVEGDIITYVEGVDVKEAGFKVSVEAMSGTEGTPINLKIRRKGKDQDFTFVRRSIIEKSVKGEMLASRIAYITISDFKSNTPGQFIDVLDRLISNGAKGIVFDLRDNDGSVIEAAEECLNPLLPEGVMATAEFKDGHSETIVYSDESELDLPMAVIINSGTQGAAELFTAVLADCGKAVAVGSQTYGKGVYQTINEMSDGGAVILTVAEIKTASGDTYNGIGITPEVPVDDTDEGYDAPYYKAVEVVTSKIQ